MDNNHEIAKIAYELYLLRGGQPGDPVADWITAERIYAERKGEQTVGTFEENIESNFVVNESVVPENLVEPAVQVKTRARKPVVSKIAPKKEIKKAEAKASATKPEKKPAESAKPKKVSRKKANGNAE